MDKTLDGNVPAARQVSRESSCVTRNAGHVTTLMTPPCKTVVLNYPTALFAAFAQV